MNNNAQPFGIRLQRLRERRGMKRYALSELCGLSRPMIGMYESGEVEPTLSALVAIAEAFGVSLDYLAGKEN